MRKLVVALLAVAMMSILSFAQTKGGDIYGTVVLADGSKVPGVLVTLTGDVIGKKTTISSEQGNFRFLSLPPGSYQLRFELQGFKTVLREGIEVSLGKTVSLNILMETSPLKEEVVVNQKVTTIDTRKTTVGVNVSKTMVDSLPTARNPWTVLSAVPGVMIDRVDVGGADSGQQSTFFANGGDQNDTTWNVDGANITDPSAIGSAPAYLNINSYSELQVTVGSNDITAQTGGVQLNFVTKRAGNKTSGDFHLYVEDKSWEMTQTPTTYMVNNGLVIPGISRLYQYGVNLGGPIIKDKLWWFGSYAIQDIHKRTETNTEDATLITSAYAKANFQLGNTTGDFHFSWDGKSKWGRTTLSPSQQDTGSLWDQSGPSKLFFAGFSHVVGELMLNLKGVRAVSGFHLDPRGSAVDPTTGHEIGSEMLNLDGWSGLAGSNQDYFTNRKSTDISFDGNYFLEGALGGDHEIKFGVDYFNATTTTQTLTPNERMTYVYDNPANDYVAIYPDYKLDVNFKRISAYLQDNMSFGKLNVNFGLRYDKEQGRVNNLTQPGFTWIDPNDPVNNGKAMYTDIITTLNIAQYKVPVSWRLLSPRLSLTYDITGDGKNVVKVSAGQYMSQSGNNMAANYIPLRYGYASWTDLNGDGRPQYNEMGSLFWTDLFTRVDPVTGMNRVKYDSNYNTPKLDELTVSFEKAVVEDLAVSLTGFYKKRHNLAFDVNSRGENTAISKGYFADGSVETAANYVEVKPGVYQQIKTPIGQYYYNYTKSYYTYLGLQAMMNKKLSNHWMANLSFTYQDFKRHLSKDDLVDYTNFDFFNGGQVAPATVGSGLRDVWVNSKWMVKLSGMYQLPWGLNFTTFFQARQGNPQPERTRMVFSQGARYIYLSGEVCGSQRLPTFWMLNLGLEKNLKISDTVSATLVVDWYNATNNQIVLKENLTNLDPTMWTNAGLFQFGVRLNF